MTTAIGSVDPTAVLGRRYTAAFVDWFLGLVLSGVLFLVLHDSYEVFGFVDCTDAPQPNVCFSTGDTIYVVEGGSAWLYYGVSLAWSIGIYWVLRGLTGKTPGTAALGLMCVNEQGRPPGVPMAVVRSVAGIVDYIPCCFPIVGIATSATTKGHRRVGDMAAKTYMIDKDHAGQLVRVDGGAGQPVGAYGIAAGTPPVAPGTPAAPHANAGPQWDPQRNAYVQWDQASGRWLVYDQAANTWRPIEGT